MCIGVGRKKYALIDWDNTIRLGFSLFTWIDYLCKNGIINKSVHSDISTHIELEKTGKITHSDLSKITGEIYASNIKGITRLELEKKIKNYMPIDESHLCVFASELFSILAKHNITVIIVSGSPEFIINHYKKRFNLYRIYALVAEEVNGIFSGKILQNYGYEKERIVESLYLEYGVYPFLSIGDSISDLAMLQVATHGFWIKREGVDIVDTSFKIFNSDALQIVQEIEAIIRH